MDVWWRSTIAYYYVNFSWGVILWQLFISPFSTDDAEYPDFTCTSLIYFKLLLVQVTDSICFAHKGLPGSFYTRYDQFHTKSYCMTNMKKKKKKWNETYWYECEFAGFFLVCLFFFKKRAASACTLTRNCRLSVSELFTWPVSVPSKQTDSRSTEIMGSKPVQKKES